MQKLYKKDLHDLDNHNGVITHLEPDPGLWSQVGLRKHHYNESKWRWWNSSWAISNSKRWCCKSAALNIAANLENSAVATGLEKISFHSNPKERWCQLMLTTTQLHSSHMLKILQARLQQYMNHELPDVQAGFRKGRGTRLNCQHPLDRQKGKRVTEKHLLLHYWLCQSHWLCRPQQTLENS